MGLEPAALSEGLSCAWRSWSALGRVKAARLAGGFPLSGTAAERAARCGAGPWSGSLFATPQKREPGHCEGQSATLGAYAPGNKHRYLRTF